MPSKTAPGLAKPWRKRVRAAVEGHPDVHGGVAGTPHMPHFMAAVAHGDPDVTGSLDDAACPLVVKDVDSAVRRQGRFVNEGAAQLGLAGHEEGLDEILLHVDVLIEELAQGLLVQIGPQAHHRKLEKACHRRRHDIDAVAVLFDVEEDPPVGKPVQDASGLTFPHVPDRSGLAGIKGRMGSSETSSASLSEKSILRSAVRGAPRVGPPVGTG